MSTPPGNAPHPVAVDRPRSPSGDRLTAAAATIATLAVLLAGAGYYVRTQGAGRVRATATTTPGAVLAGPTGAVAGATGEVPDSTPTDGVPSDGAGSDGAATSSTGTASTTAPAVRVPPARVDTGTAVAQLTAAGIAVAGDPVRAWRWTDANGVNLLLTTSQVTSHYTDTTGVNGITLRVVQAARLDSTPTVLRRLVDAGVGPCENDYTFQFTNDLVAFTDRNADGVLEATIGWWEMCRGDIGPATVKLGVLTGGNWFVLRGVGFPDQRPAASYGTFPALTFTPSPAAPGWPRGSYAPTVELFRQLYR